MASGVELADDLADCRTELVLRKWEGQRSEYQYCNVGNGTALAVALSRVGLRGYKLCAQNIVQNVRTLRSNPILLE